MSPEKQQFDIPEAPQPSFDLSKASAGELSKRYPEPTSAKERTEKNPGPSQKQLQNEAFSKIQNVADKRHEIWAPIKINTDAMSKKPTGNEAQQNNGNTQSKRIGETF